MYQLCKSIYHMHRNGIFHRDVKPENILIKVGQWTNLVCLFVCLFVCLPLLLLLLLVVVVVEEVVVVVVVVVVMRSKDNVIM